MSRANGYKSKNNPNTEINPPRKETTTNKLKKDKKIYKAIIFEEDGKQEILYRCDKKRNAKCNKKNCGLDDCNYTIDKEYAIDFAKDNDVQVKETKYYNNGELTAKVISYKYR